MIRPENTIILLIFIKTQDPFVVYILLLKIFKHMHVIHLYVCIYIHALMPDVNIRCSLKTSAKLIGEQTLPFLFYLPMAGFLGVHWNARLLHKSGGCKLV